MGYYHIQVLSNAYINSRILLLYYHQASQLVDSQMEIMQVDQYESDTLDEDITEKNDAIKRAQKICAKIQTKFWMKNTTFNTVSEAEALIKSGWSKHYANYTDKGKRVYYRCKKARRRGPQCGAGVFLLYHLTMNLLKFILYQLVI